METICPTQPHVRPPSTTRRTRVRHHVEAHEAVAEQQLHLLVVAGRVALRGVKGPRRIRTDGERGREGRAVIESEPPPTCGLALLSLLARPHSYPPGVSL